MAKVDAIDIRPHDLKTVREILRRHVPGHEVWAFGSRVRWTARDYSDLDLAIRTAEPIPSETVNAIKEELSESDLPMKVDVLDMASVSDKFRKIIEEEYVVVQESVATKAGQNLYSIEEVAEIIGGGTPSTKDGKNFGGEIPWITPKDLSGSTDRYISKGERNITPEGLAKSSAKILPENAVLLSTRAPIGYLAIAKNPLTTNQGFRSLVVKDGFNPLFVYYLLRHNVEYLKSHASGTTFGELRGSTLKSLRFSFPSYAEQRRIAHILGTLDDKIELNRQTNKTLESMAQAIFKSWFVNFDPVHSKAEGRDTGLSPEVADLFPDGFEDSNLGLIPRGWEVAPLSELAELRTNMVQPYKYPEDIWEHYSIPAYDESRLPVVESGANIKSGKYLVPENAVLISKLNPQFPRVWLPALIDAHRPVCSTEFLPFVPHHPGWRPYLYHLAKSSLFQTEIANRVTGTSGSHQRAKPLDILGIPFPMPSAQIRAMFGAMTGYLSTRTQTSLREARVLEVARDALLPKLLDGSTAFSK